MTPEPPVVLTQSDFRRLERAAFDFLLREPRQAGLLLSRIYRARLAPDAERDPEVAHLGSTVTYVEIPGRRAPRTVRLVAAPDDVEGPADVTALSGLGAALIGLCAGARTRLATRVGGERDLRLVAVTPARPGPP